MDAGNGASTAVAVAGVEGDAGLVETCPHPPLYYKLFKTPDHLIAPVLSEEARNVSFTSARQYNGTVTAQLLQQHQPDTEPPKEGFKAEMKATLQQILDDSLAIISPDSSRAPRNTEQRLQPLRTSIDRMYAAIAAYQTHEAREHLCQDMAAQINRLQDIKNELTRCVNESGEELWLNRLPHRISSIHFWCLFFSNSHRLNEDCGGVVSRGN